MKVDEFIEKSLAVTDVRQLLDLYQSAMSAHGYDRCVYTLITDHISINKPARHGILFTYPDEWMDYYMEKNYDRHDPVIRAGAIARRPFLWNDLCAGVQLTKLQSKIMHEADDAHLHDGLGIPIFGGPGEIAGVGLASSSGGVNPDPVTVSVLRAITYQFHALYCEYEAASLQDKFPQLPPRLSPREREILTWLAEGKSVPVVADLLNIDINTAKTHLKRIYAKLNASEKTMAVLKAYTLGLISPLSVRPH
jgi:LuxR family quorum sensing-dependent transcriptional regulator